MRGSQILASEIMPTAYDIKRASDEIIRKVLEKANFLFTDLEKVFSTGYGRHSISFASKAVTEIHCHGKGAHFEIMEARVIIDIGCQDSKVIRINGNGDVTDFAMNDKCAAGTGRFLEVMASALGLKIDEMGSESLKSTNPSEISSICTVFAESEVISQRAQGAKREDLVAGIHKSISKRIISMASSIKLDKKIVFTGGVAKNLGVKRALEEQSGQLIAIPKDPQLIGALGAAILAQTERS